jgi:hypothetical protein
MTTETRTLIATDEGTHGQPRTTRVYRLANGKYQTIVRSGDGLISDETTDACPRDSEIKTAGRVRHVNQ